MIHKSKFFIAFFVFVFSCLLSLIIVSKQTDTPEIKCLCESGAYIDLFEYHFLSYNLYSKNAFPVLGFLGKEGAYHFCADRKDDVPMHEFYLGLFKKGGSVTITTRPPVYPFLMAAVYKIFGYDLKRAEELNCFLFAVMFAIMATFGWWYGSWPGLIGGVIAGTILLWFNPYNNSYLLPDITLVFLTLLFFVVAFVAASTRRKAVFFASGLIFALGLLTKGMLLPLLPLIIAALLFVYGLGKGANYSMSFISGVVLILLPWVIFINETNVKTKGERDRWLSFLHHECPIVQKESYADLVADNNAKTISLKGLINYFYSFYMQSPPFIMLTSQVSGEVMYRYHNELCSDGDIHAEFILLKNSFYNTYQGSETGYGKILAFYKKHPWNLGRFAWAKLKLGFLSNEFPLLLWSVIITAFAVLIQLFSSNKKVKLLLIASLLLLVAIQCSLNAKALVLAVALIIPIPIFIIQRKPNSPQFFIGVLFLLLWYTMAFITVFFNGCEEYTGIIIAIAAAMLVHGFSYLIRIFLNAFLRTSE